MSVEKIKSALNNVIVKLNRIELKTMSCGGYTYKSRTEIRSITQHSFGYQVLFYNDNLKIGGEDDDDSNDEVMFRDLSKHFEKFLSDYDKDIVIENMDSDYKGCFSATFTLKSEKNKNKKLQENQKKIDKINEEIRIFNNSVGEKIKQQKSSKKTCPTCGSMLTISYLKSHICPVCTKPMYTETESKKLSVMKGKIDSLQSEINSLIKKGV
jgi:rRNA maturation endonuclease Nob1